MTETVVHVTTLEQWKSVLDVWFKQGYKWNTGDTEYSYYLFTEHKHLVLQFFEGGHYIHCTDEGLKSIEYSEFMAQQKEDKEVKTYYVTQEQLDLIIFLKQKKAPLDWLIMDYDNTYRALRVDITNEKSNAVLRHLGGDKTVEFKVKEQFYRLWRVDGFGDTVYMKFSYGTPSYSSDKDRAFIAPLEEIKKWQTPAWEVEKAD